MTIFKKLPLIIMFAFATVHTTYAESESNNPLIGKILSVENNKFVTLAMLKEKVLTSDHVIVGETHDNEEHHQIQAQVLGWFIEAKKSVNPVFEMLSKEQLSKTKNSLITSSDSFFDKVAWDDSGWPDRKLYKPIFDIVIEQNLPIIGAETERNVLMQLMQKGEKELPTEIMTYMNLVSLNPKFKNQIKQDIIDSHCGMLPEKMVDPMILGQRVRDAVMAKVVIEASATGTTLLIAGSGHGRKDYGVPAYIKSRQPQASITAISIMEVVEDVQDPAEYSEAWASDVIPFDYVWFTKRIERDDPCEELKQHFKKHPA